MIVLITPAVVTSRSIGVHRTEHRILHCRVEYEKLKVGTPEADSLMAQTDKTVEDLPVLMMVRDGVVHTSISKPEDIAVYDLVGECFRRNKALEDSESTTSSHAVHP
jgi:hypothetical protein